MNEETSNQSEAARIASFICRDIKRGLRKRTREMTDADDTGRQSNAAVMAS
jgi:hypothetical protein